jgi:crotonobetainyl-CoA:carnitine CoA-transferase CaiB-like acyl-CoA transferase
MPLLAGFEVVQLGDGLAAAVCARLLADIGANVTCIDLDSSTHLAAYLNHDKTIVTHDRAARRALSTADLIVCEGRPGDLRDRQHDADALRRVNPSAALVYISPFGQTGQRPTTRRAI